jgi:hypothetical protein
LFKGKSIDGRYAGTAYIFNGSCGQIPYEVSGPILDNYERVVLQGNAPRVGSNCRIQGYIADTLEFTLLKADTAGTLSNAVMPDVNGVWKPLSADNRLMTIKMLKDKITIQAIDLSCELSELQPQENNTSMTPPSVTSNSVCDEESDTIYTKETLTTLRVGQDMLLIDATVLQRHVNENSDSKVDETYTKQAPLITIYLKVK